MTAALLIALSSSIAIWWLSVNLRLISSAGSMLEEYYGQRESRQEKIGRLVGGKVLDWQTWENHLRWAQRGGLYTGQTLGLVLFQCLLFGGVAGLVILINPAPVALLLPVLGFAYPLVRLRAKANTVRKRVARMLPETASLISAELSAGTAADVALERAASLPGPLSILLQEALKESLQSGRPLFSRKPGRGALFDTFAKAGLPSLYAFSAQLDLVSSKGVAGAMLMNEIARALASEYRARLQSDVEKLNSRLVLLVMIFFFVPFLGLLLYAALAPVMEVFLG